MKVSVGDLDKRGFILKEKFHYKDLSVFVQQYLSKTNAATIAFLTVNILFIIAITAQVVSMVIHHVNVLYAILASIVGIFSIVIIVPVHEAIHAIAYKCFGAKDVSFEISLKKFVVLTVADQFVASQSEFSKILLAPFAVITILLLSLYFFTGVYVQLGLLTAIVTHSFLCAGDFGLTSYFLSYKDETIVTYDDKAEQTSYFFVKGVIE